MSDTQDILSQLPDPHDAEPPELRAAIADELADHLHCAMARELRRSTGEDERSARQRMLDRFGNPAAIARQLYLQAMKEHIMKDRILIGSIALLAIVCLASVALSWRAMEQTRLLNEQMMLRLTEIANRPAPTPMNYEWSSLTVEVVDDQGKPFEGCEVRLSGDPFGTAGDSSVKHLDQRSDSAGIARFHPIRVGGYRIMVSTPEGLSLSVDPGRFTSRSGPGIPPGKSVTVRPQQDAKLRFVAPRISQLNLSTVKVKLDFPADVEQEDLVALVGFDSSATPIQVAHDETKWTLDQQSFRVLVGKKGVALIKNDEWSVREVPGAPIQLILNNVSWRQTLELPVGSYVRNGISLLREHTSGEGYEEVDGQPSLVGNSPLSRVEVEQSRKVYARVQEVVPQKSNYWDRVRMVLDVEPDIEQQWTIPLLYEQILKLQSRSTEPTTP